MSIFRRFTRSPFGPLEQLLKVVDECVEELERMVAANLAGDFELVKEHFRVITKTEHTADEVKDSIRDALPSSIHLPIDRDQFLDIIAKVDDIADSCEDIGYLLTIRRTTVPEQLQEPFRALFDKCVETYRALRQIMGHVDELVDTGFAKPLVREMMAGVRQVNHLEWESDKLSYKFSQALFELEDQLGPIEIMMLHDIAKVIGKFADACEKLAKGLRNTLAD